MNLRHSDSKGGLAQSPSNSDAGTSWAGPGFACYDVADLSSATLMQECRLSRVGIVSAPPGRFGPDIGQFSWNLPEAMASAIWGEGVPDPATDVHLFHLESAFNFLVGRLVAGVEDRQGSPDEILDFLIAAVRQVAAISVQE